MVAPQPFFRPRGTPFSVLHRVRALGELGCQTDLIAYPFGDDIKLPGLRLIRSRRVPFVRDVKIGPSVSKAFLDLPLAHKTWYALRKNRYDLIHSHEEAAFFCAPLARRFGLPHVYDMHSSLPQQLANFNSFNFSLIRKTFAALEHHVLSSCDGVITICQDLADVAEPHCRKKPHSMIENTADNAHVFSQVPVAAETEHMDFPGKQVVLYTGTFEAYQGLDLLIEAFARIPSQRPDAHLVLVGGRPHQVDAYKSKAHALGLAGHTTFVGQVHPSRIPGFIRSASLIVSPRSTGTNTPLKIYEYLRSERPIVATNLHTHTQTLNQDVAELVPPSAEGLAEGMLRVLGDPTYARKLAESAKRLADDQYSDHAYMRKVGDFYVRVLDRMRASRARQIDDLPGIRARP